jgi:hypothetical protein
MMATPVRAYADDSSQQLLEDERLARSIAQGEARNAQSQTSHDPYYRDPYYANMPQRHYYGAWRAPAAVSGDGRPVVIYRDADPDLHACW